MKLLFCEKCWDVFKLSSELRSCKCGLVKGKYINNTEAVVNGEGQSIAIGNGSLERAVLNAKAINSDRSEYIQKAGMIAWVRPHTGDGNPHTKIKTL